MRGRTNVINNANNSGGNIEINGNIETFNIADNNVINEGDFVSVYKNASPVTNAIQLISGYKSGDIGFLSYLGEYMGNKLYYMTSDLLCNNGIFLICYSQNGNILFSTNMPASGNNERSINEMIIVEKYIVYARKNYIDGSDYCQLLLYTIDINNKRVEKIYEYNMGIKTYFDNAPVVCNIDDERFLVGIYDYNDGVYAVTLYKINEEDDVSIEMIDRINIDNCLGSSVLNKIENKIIVIGGTKDGLYCSILELKGDSLNEIINCKISSSNLNNKDITSIAIIENDIIICGTNGKLYAIDTMNGIIKSEYIISNLNSITYKDGILYGVVMSGSVYDALYITVIKYNNGVFSEIKNTELFAISNIKIGSASPRKCAYIIFFDNRTKLIMYYYYANSNYSYMRYFVEMDIKKIGYNFVLDGDCIRPYDGSSAIGVAKTGGKGGDTIEVYVPLQNLN